MSCSRMWVFGTVLFVMALSLFGCGSHSQHKDCADDDKLYKTTDVKHEKFGIGGSLVVSTERPEFNITNNHYYADLDIVYFDSLLWVNGKFVDPETGLPIDDVMESRGCQSANFKRQHEIRTVIDDTNTLGSYFMWSFSPTFEQDDLPAAAEQLATIVYYYGDGVNLKWDPARGNRDVFKTFLCELHKSFTEKNLQSSKISVSGPFTSLYNRNGTRPSNAKSSGGVLGDLLKSHCGSVSKVSAFVSTSTPHPTSVSVSTSTLRPSLRAATAGSLVVDFVNWIEAEVFNLNARHVFNKVNRTPSGKGDRFYFSIAELNHTVDWLGTAFNKSKVRLSFKTGQQPGPGHTPLGMWEGPKADLEMMYRLKKSKFGGFTFWGMNAYRVAGSEVVRQSPCCLDPDVTNDWTFRQCGDGRPGREANISCSVKADWQHKKCAWWKGDTPLNAAWLIQEFKKPIDTSDCPFNHTVYCKNNIVAQEMNPLRPIV